ncbi:MAG: hypothetical protein DCC46_08795 [Armatimonadetes bacterium]|nr:MAG: hypothetical protein DCC46_08795 [Armatimonadota bacterium]
MSRKSAFTLIELLVVIAIIGCGQEDELSF